MKNVFFYISLIFLTINCQSEPKEEKGIFPDNLVVQKTNQHQRVPGTNLFAMIPDGYQFVKPFRFAKSDDEFVIISKLEQPFKYFERKSALEAKDPEAKTIVFREINFNNEKAIFKESFIAEKNQHFYLLNYGTDIASFLIVSQCKLDNAASRQEMMEILKSICLDPTAEFDPLEIASFDFDKSITNFKIAKANLSDFRYTSNGKYENNNKIVNSILVSEIAQTTYDNRIQLMEYWSSTYVKSSKSYGTNKFKETKIGAYNAIEYETDFSLNGVPGKVYFAILSDEKNRTMKFTGIAFNEIEYQIKKYKQTVQSIIFK